MVISVTAPQAGCAVVANMSSTAERWGSVATHFFLNANNSVLLKILLRSSGGQFPFRPTLLALYIELCKLLVSVVMIIREEDGSFTAAYREVIVSLRHQRQSARYIVPAFLYTIVNNGGVFVMLYLSPIEAILTGQLRIVFTVLLMRILLKEQYSWVQWSSLLLLLSGSVQLQGLGCDSKLMDDEVEIAETSRRLFGLFVSIVNCLASAGASVYSQSLLTLDESVNVANTKLYGFGVICSFIAYAIDCFLSSSSSQNNIITFWGMMYIMNMSMCGIAISRLLKHAGAVVKLFSAAASACLVYVYSMWFGFPQETSGTTLLFAGINIFTGLFIFSMSKDSKQKVKDSLALPDSKWRESPPKLRKDSPPRQSSDPRPRTVSMTDASY